MSGKYGARPPAGTPSLAERSKPGLSDTLPGPRAPGICQRCGTDYAGSDQLRVWLECDAWDRDSVPPVFVILCRRCSDTVIDAHPRLYKRQDPHAPNLGAMALCVACRHRDGLRCTAELSKQNGGPGMEVRYLHTPTYCHVRGTGFSGFRWFYSGAPISCAGHVPRDDHEFGRVEK